MITIKAHQPPEPTTPDPGDAELQERIRRFLGTKGIRQLGDIHIDVDGGTVVLRGPIASPHDRWLCVNCSSRVAGVLHVVDKLEGRDGVARIRRPR